LDWLYSLKVFATVADTGKTTRAGDSLFLTQPAVSMQIKLLEDFYETKLFTRDPSGLKLTETGKVLYSHAKKILTMFDEMNDEIKTSLRCIPDKPNNDIRVGSCILISETYMPWLLHNFMKEHPDFSISFSSMDYPSNIRSLVEGSVDIAIVGFRDTSDRKSEERLKFEKCSKELLEIVVPRSYGLQNMQKINIQFLIGKKYISTKPECGICCAVNPILTKHHNVTLMDFQEVSFFGSGSAVKQAVIEDIGWSILPKDFVSQDLSEGKFNNVRLEGPKNPFYRWIYLVYPRSKNKFPPVKLFLEFVRKLKGKYCSVDRLKQYSLIDDKTKPADLIH
jgi:DNA-binding transcriptional LysR family regulator